MRSNRSLQWVLVLSVAMAGVLLTAAWAGADPIAIPNPAFETRGTYDPFADGVDKYNQYGKEYWRQLERTYNGGPLRIWNPGAPGVPTQGAVDVGFGGNAAEGTYVVLARSRYSDGVVNSEGATPGSTIYFEAAVQLLTTTFNPNMVYTMTAAVGNPGGSNYYTPTWLGYVVQLAAGGANVGGAQYAGSVTGGTVIAQDIDGVLVPVDGWATSTVTYRPRLADAAQAGKALQVRLGALEDPTDLTRTPYAAFDDVTLDGVAGLFWDINGTAPGAGGATPSGTWSAASTNWNATFAGTGATAAWTAGGVAYFAAGEDANGTYTVTVDGTQNISRLYFAGGTVTLANGTAGAIRLTSNATMDVAPGLTATVETPVSEDAAGRQLLKSSAGTLILSGDLSHTGVTSVANGGGTLVLSGNNVAATGGMSLNGGVTQFESPASINGTARDVSVNSAGTVVFGSSFPDANIPTALSERIVAASAGTIAADNHAATNFDFDTPGLTAAYFGAAGSVTYTGTLTPNGSVYRLGGGGGTLTMADANAVTGAGKSLIVGGGGSAGTVVLASSNDYDAGTTLSYGGTLAVGNDNALGSGALTINGGVIRSADSSAHALANALAFGSGVTVGVIVDGTGDLTFSNTSDTPLGNTRYFTINNPNSTFAQAFSGTGAGLVKAGPGTLILSGANTYTGTTTIRQGILRLGANDVMPDPNATTFSGGAITVGGRMAGVIATLDLNGYDDTIGTLSLACYTSTSGSAVTTGAGTLTLGGDPNNAVTYSNSNNPLGATISGKIGLAASAIGTRIFTVGNSTTAEIDLDVSADISGPCGLTKAGAGTMVVSGNMSHTGVTTMSAGLLVLSGDNIAATGGMSLNGGVTQFDSLGSINGTGRNVAVNTGAVAVLGPSFADANIPAGLSRITTDSGGAIAADNHDAANFDFETAGLTDIYLGAVGNVTYSGTLTPNSAGGYRLGGGGGTLTYGQVLTGSGVILTVGGNVVLPNANDYDGGTILNAGTLGVGNNGALGDGPVLFNGGAIASADDSAHTLANPLLFNSNVNVGGTGDLTFSDTSDTPLDDNRTFTITNPSTTFAQAFSGSGYSIIKAGSGKMVLSGACTYDGVTFISGGTLVLAGSNSSNGDTTVSAGTLQLASDPNGGLAGGKLYFGNATAGASAIQALNADRTIASNTVLNNTHGVVSGSQSIEITGTFTNSLGNRTLTNNLDSGKTLTLSGQVLLSEHATTGRTLTVAGTGDTTISGQIVNGATGNGALTMSGTGTLALTNTGSTYGGVTNIAAGTMAVSKLADGGQPSSIGQSSNAHTNLLIGNNATLKYTGAGDTTNRLFRFNGNLAGLSITLDASGAGPIVFSNTGSPTHSNANQVRTLNLTGSNTDDNTLGLKILNNGSGLLSIVKSGDGTWVLSGANTYTGATTVNTGTLKVNGSLAAGSVVTVAGGALGGTGVIGGPVTVEIGGALAPGASAGTLSTGPVSMAANSTYEWDIDSSAADKVVVTGNLTLTTGWKLSLASADGTKPDGGVEYDIFTYTGDFTAGSTILAAITQPVDWPIAIINQDTTPGAGRIYLTFGQPGDTNDDGVVDAADFITVKKNFGGGLGGDKTVGNFDESGTVDWADLSILMTNFGAGGPAPATAPEPATLGLLAIGALAVLKRRKTA